MWRWATLLVLCVLTFLIGLNRQAITDSDEAFYAEAGREMVVTGDWVTPHFNFEPRLQKPILFYWMVAATYSVTGVGEGAARFWAAMSGLGLALVACAVAWRWYGAGTGLLAGTIAATSLGVTMLARMALPDGPLAFFVTLSIWSALEAFLSAPPRSASRWLMLSAIALALGVLTKGPLAVVLWLIVVPPAVWWERRRTTTPWAVTWRDILIACGVVVVLTAPWFIAVTRAQGIGYLRQFLVGENLERFATTRYNDHRPIWYYVPVMLGGLLPWSAFMLLWVEPVAGFVRRARATSSASLRLLVWIAAPLLLFSVSIGKQPRYILPCLAPLAVLLAHAIWQRVSTEQPDRRDRGLVTSGVMAGLVLSVVGLLILRVSPILVAADPGWSPLGPWTMVAAGVGVSVAAFARNRRVLLAGLSAASAVAGLVIQVSAFSPGRPEPVERIAERILAEGPVSTACACGAFTRNLNFYTHARTVVGDPREEIERFLGQPDRVFAAMDAELVPLVEAAMHRRFPRVMEVTYVNVAALRVGSLIDPDPERQLQRVILITNR